MRLALTSTLLLAAVLVPGRGAAAEGIFRYVEKDGTVIYTNVPPGPQAKAKRVSGTFHQAPKETEAPQAVRTAEDLDAFIETAAKRYKIPSALVRAVVHAESNFDRMAVSPKGASGLMQLMPGTAENMYVKDIFDARDNIEGGTRYLRVLANLYQGDMVRMVAAYNAGPEAVRKYGGTVPPYAETQAYVRKVINLYFKYKAQAAQGADAAAAK